VVPLRYSFNPFLFVCWRFGSEYFFGCSVVLPIYLTLPFLSFRIFSDSISLVAEVSQQIHYS
jgi:hypothetical protein